MLRICENYILSNHDRIQYKHGINSSIITFLRDKNTKDNRNSFVIRGKKEKERKRNVLFEHVQYKINEQEKKRKHTVIIKRVCCKINSNLL